MVSDTYHYRNELVNPILNLVENYFLKQLVPTDVAPREIIPISHIPANDDELGARLYLLNRPLHALGELVIAYITSNQYPNILCGVYGSK